jgi:hypothetical protein
MFLFVAKEMKDGGVTWVDLSLLCEQGLDDGYGWLYR